MQALTRKLWRELWNMRLQALAITLVIVSGVSVFIMSLSTYDSLFDTRETYYRDYQFAEIFANLKRAPDSLITRIRALPGVDKAESRIVSYVNLEIEGYEGAASAHLISEPSDGEALLNRLYLTSGRLLDPNKSDEIIVSTEFAKAHRLQAGDYLRAIINGHSKRLTIVGTALSPEYIYQIAPGAMFPDYKSYGVMWMARTPLASAYDMHGAFNDVVLRLTQDGNEQQIIDAVDELLKPYGGLGAYARKDQLSNRFLTEELKQLQNMATVFPVIFFSVAAFLLSVVIQRLIALEREQIATLKAFGYSALHIGWHYSQLVIVVVLFGIVIGTLLGIWMGQGMSHLYKEIYSLPYLHYRLEADIILWAAVISIGMGLLGTFQAVKKAVSLPPAQGMRPEIPTQYRQTMLEKMGLQQHFSQPSRMILRHIERRPFKAMLTTLGLSLACSIMMVSGFQEGAIKKMIEVQYQLSQHQDMTVYFSEPTSKSALSSLQSFQGVAYAEGFRHASVRLKYQHRSYRTMVQGVNPDSSLTRLLDKNLQRIPLPEQGVIITDYLSEQLGIQVGETLIIEVLEGSRPTLEVTVVGTAKEYLGLNVYMQQQQLNRLLKEGPVLSGAHIKVDTHLQNGLFQTLKQQPRIIGVIEQKSAIKGFYDTMDDTILFFSFITTLLGASIAFGVVYNSLRIALSERNRELASLRVLGFRQGEIGYILLGEQALLTLISLPIGFLIGNLLCHYLAVKFDSDLYRIPMVLEPDVYALATAVILISSLLSGLLLWRNLAQLDMVSVLKAKE